jgi:hypothetical protein
MKLKSTLKISFTLMLLALSASQQSQANTQELSENIKPIADVYHMPGIWATGVINNDPHNIYTLEAASTPMSLNDLSYWFSKLFSWKVDYI